ncbi:hypothetical protein [Paraburkholderia rhizosphaerae]|uniref:Uncharacterized protein n=1 Tax=Paraburkholderia rhizosphaerae TaxID=480658 RepID=A0A4R8LMQ5_9BURK|nr:hypothetical protein [Paraburkholderia rhizosphaerae]TDY44498.1 hypothetical protein BX592_116146 [Paraburkholderia rhizosphaerae]
MKHEPLSHCPDRTNAAILRAGFNAGSRAAHERKPNDRTHPQDAPVPRFFVRLRITLRRLFTRGTPDHTCVCDIDARLLELELHKLNMQHLGNLHH